MAYFIAIVLMFFKGIFNGRHRYFKFIFECFH